WQTTAASIRRPTAALALVLLATSLATSGHASSASPAWLTQPAVGFHALAVTLWIGSFLPLAHSLQTETKPNLLKFFSRLIPTILIVLFISGGILVYAQFDTLSSLWQTQYGQLLALKLTLLTALIGFGAYNRYRLTNAVRKEQPNARNAMRRVIHLECVLAVAIFATVALWRFTPPPRALNSAVQSTPTISAHIHADNASADLSWTRSARTQTSTLTLYLSKADLTPLNAQEVSVSFTNAGAGIQPIDFSAKRTNDGAWQITNIDLPNLPTWHIRINALITDFERIHLETTLGGDK
ncbi:MAG TPA: copper resistance protein CopC, partial [Pusillimonas sp.]|nr:copper resistance protein CopC [Pusillimonas sp.]